MGRPGGPENRSFEEFGEPARVDRSSARETGTPHDADGPQSAYRSEDRPTGKGSLEEVVRVGVPPGP